MSEIEQALADAHRALASAAGRLSGMLADGRVVEVSDPTSVLGFRLEFPDVVVDDCPGPGSGAACESRR